MREVYRSRFVGFQPYLKGSAYPTLRKQREGPRISYCAAPAMAACAAFYKESRIKFANATKPDRKSGGQRAT